MNIQELIGETIMDARDAFLEQVAFMLTPERRLRAVILNLG